MKLEGIGRWKGLTDVSVLNFNDAELRLKQSGSLLKKVGASKRC